ncbi:hypothetical protein E2986_11962 [Frieseomelitta varia]|uniref:RabBD domain-containing protein n=1 Tax=Frieseomelitta varia TaxID=561572 RepID=A0A833W821_9HYME|nr:hypothetical protein E2986_11962 [Frieseomelitta varia]
MAAVPDMSHLTPEERSTIEEVIIRQKQEEEKENEIMRRKQDEVKILEERIRACSEKHKKAGVELHATCHICLKTKFADGVGHICNYCSIRCCARCGGKVTLRSNKIKKLELTIPRGQASESDQPNASNSNCYPLREMRQYPRNPWTSCHPSLQSEMNEKNMHEIASVIILRDRFASFFRQIRFHRGLCSDRSKAEHDLRICKKKHDIITVLFFCQSNEILGEFCREVAKDFEILAVPSSQEFLSLPVVIWVCILCRKKQELLSKTGQWITKGGLSAGDNAMLRRMQEMQVGGPPGLVDQTQDKRPKLERAHSAAEKENLPLLLRGGSLLRRQYSQQEQLSELAVEARQCHFGISHRMSHCAHCH